MGGAAPRMVRRFQPDGFVTGPAIRLARPGDETSERSSLVEVHAPTSKGDALLSRLEVGFCRMRNRCWTPNAGDRTLRTALRERREDPGSG